MSDPFLTKELADREFVALGEKQVRDFVATNRYNKQKHALAEHWLREQADARVEALADTKDRRDAGLARENVAVARSAKNAAWVSNIMAAIAIVVSLVALYLSLK